MCTKKHYKLSLKPTYKTAKKIFHTIAPKAFQSGCIFCNPKFNNLSQFNGKTI